MEINSVNLLTGFFKHRSFLLLSTRSGIVMTKCTILGKHSFIVAINTCLQGECRGQNGMVFSPPLILLLYTLVWCQKNEYSLEKWLGLDSLVLLTALLPTTLTLFSRQIKNTPHFIKVSKDNILNKKIEMWALKSCKKSTQLWLFLAKIFANLSEITYSENNRSIFMNTKYEHYFTLFIIKQK